MNELNYEKVFNVLTARLEEYCIEHKIKSLVLGISGGIDSTVVAAIAREVCDRIHIPLIGRSLPIKNKDDEFHTSKLVGRAFCDSFCTVELEEFYNNYLDFVEEEGVALLGVVNATQDKIQNGNLQARLRMMYLYNIAGITKGMVLSTDNQTEYQLGFWTIHGDVGDYDPIQALWKTEVYGLAKWLVDYYSLEMVELGVNFPGCHDYNEQMENFKARMESLNKSITLVPTDGLGISNSDLDQIGAKSYEDVDTILKALLTPMSGVIHKSVIGAYCEKYGKDVVDKIWDRHLKSEFKRLKAPISVPRKELI